MGPSPRGNVPWWDLGRFFGEAKRAKRWKNAGFLSGGNCWMWEDRTENGGT